MNTDLLSRLDARAADESSKATTGRSAATAAYWQAVASAAAGEPSKPGDVEQLLAVLAVLGLTRAQFSADVDDVKRITEVSQQNNLRRAHDAYKSALAAAATAAADARRLRERADTALRRAQDASRNAFDRVHRARANLAAIVPIADRLRARGYVTDAVDKAMDLPLPRAQNAPPVPRTRRYRALQRVVLSHPHRIVAAGEVIELPGDEVAPIALQPVADDAPPTTSADWHQGGAA